MATTSANINSGITLATKNGNNICHIPTLVIITINHQCPKIAGHTNTLTPSVLEIIKINIFFRPGRSHVRNWRKLVLSLKILVLLKRIFDLQKELVLGETQDAVTKCLKSLPPDMSWNNVKPVLWQQLSLV